MGTRRVKDLTKADINKVLKDTIAGKTRVSVKTKKLRGKAIRADGEVRRSRKRAVVELFPKRVCAWRSAVSRATAFRRDEAGVERRKVAQLRHSSNVRKVDQVHIDQPVQGAAVQEAQDLSEHERRSNRTHERSTDRLACQQRHAATVEGALVEHLAIGRRIDR